MPAHGCKYASAAVTLQKVPARFRHLIKSACEYMQVLAAHNFHQTEMLILSWPKGWIKVQALRQ